jgi:hypothetical protein
MVCGVRGSARGSLQPEHEAAQRRIIIECRWIPVHLEQWGSGRHELPMAG